MRFSPAEFSLPVNGLIEVELESMELALAAVEAGVATEAAAPASARGRGSELETALPASTASSARDPLA